MTSIDKFCLKWSDFEINIRQTFKELREDQNQLDVTLATDDGYQIQAHKLILSAGSMFFGKIFVKPHHPHPFIYLKGIQKDTLKNVLDFLYNGEANVAQKDLNTFLETTKELQVKGLQHINSEGLVNHGEQKQNNEHIMMIEPKNDINQHTTETDKFSDSSDGLTETSIDSHEIVLKTEITEIELDQQIEQMIEKKIEENRKLWKCKVCGKTMEQKGKMKLHAETHMWGMISHTCHICNKVCSTRRTLKEHIDNIHSGLLFDCDLCSKTGFKYRITTPVG
jgi:hypothetical protein